MIKMNVILILLILVSLSVFSQVVETKPLELEKFDKQTSRSLNELLELNKMKSSLGVSDLQSEGINPISSDFSRNIIDDIVDPDEYTVGPNDKIAVFIWGSTNKSFILSVSPEGIIPIPSIGPLKAKGMKLNKLKKEIKKKLRSQYLTRDISVLLYNLRTFKTFVLGSVSNPGSYVVTGATRVSELIKIAGGPKPPEAARSRGIIIKNPSHPDRIADLAIFRNSNDISGDPYLREGDRVFISPRKEIISINGSANYTGLYDWVPSDCLKDILKICGGLRRGADKDNILLTRFLNNADSIKEFTLSWPADSLFKINRDDRILIRPLPEYRKHLNVEISGEVMHPGIYPIRHDKTKIKEIIEMAGGLTKNASLRGSKVVRESFTRSKDREFERLKTVPVGVLTPIERSYLKSKLTEEEGTVSINFTKLFNSKGELHNIILRSGDQISIAKKNLTVRVSGAVISPGLIGYSENRDYSYYIKQAGGFNTRARKNDAVIIKNSTGVWLEPEKVEQIEAGDKIWIPEKGYKDWFQFTKDIMLIASSIATIILSGITVYDRY
ncbi:MAG: SLBB domain-containing protein [Fibrobacterota bacterium]